MEDFYKLQVEALQKQLKMKNYQLDVLSKELEELRDKNEYLKAINEVNQKNEIR